METLVLYHAEVMASNFRLVKLLGKALEFNTNLKSMRVVDDQASYDRKSLVVLCKFITHVPNVYLSLGSIRESKELGCICLGETMPAKLVMHYTLIPCTKKQEIEAVNRHLLSSALKKSVKLLHGSPMKSKYSRLVFSSS